MMQLKAMAVLQRVLAATFRLCLTLIIVILSASSSMAGKDTKSIEYLLNLMIHEKVGRITKPGRSIRVSLVTADGEEDLQSVSDKMATISELANFGVFSVGESIVNANRTPSRRVRKDSDAIIIVGTNIMHYGIRTLGFHIIDFVEKYASKDFLTILTELSSGDWQCKLYRWNNEDLEVDKYLMVLDYSFDATLVEKCETLFLLNLSGIFAQESDLIVSSTIYDGVVVEVNPNIKLAVRSLYSGHINRGDSESVVRDKLRRLMP